MKTNKRKPIFGMSVVNTAASDGNPTKYGCFVREIRRTGRLNPGLFYEITNGSNRFWQTKAEFVEIWEPPKP